MAKSLFDAGCEDGAGAWADAPLADMPGAHVFSTALGVAFIGYSLRRLDRGGSKWWLALTGLGAANLLGNFGVFSKKTDKVAPAGSIAQTAPGLRSAPHKPSFAPPKSENVKPPPPRVFPGVSFRRT